MKNRILRLFLAISLAFSTLLPLAVPVGTVALTTACASKGRLDPAGVYQGDAVLYNADKTISTAYEAMHEFVLWEYENREALSGTPAIAEAANRVRADAKRYLQSAVAMRDRYARTPISEHQKALDAALEALQQAVLEAQKFVQKKPAN